MAEPAQLKKKRTDLKVALVIVVVIAAVVLIPQSRSALVRLLKNEQPNEGKTTKEWTGELASPDADTRALAAKELGKMGSEAAAAAPALAKTLDDKDSRVRLEAVFALTKI